VKKKEEEFDGMPERSELGEKAFDFLEIKDGIEKDQEKLKKCGEELLELFKKEGKTMISIRGRCIKKEHINQDKIKVLDMRK